MRLTCTRQCTEVYYGRTAPDHRPAFVSRHNPRITHFDQRVFKSRDHVHQDDVLKALYQIQQIMEQHKIKDQLVRLKKQKKAKLSWSDKVNKKRRLIRDIIKNACCPNISAIAKRVNASYKTVKSIMTQMSTQGAISPFEYNNLKTQEQEDTLERTIDEVPRTFLTVSTIKRQNPDYSRKKILQALHDRGLRYRLMPKAPLIPEKCTINSTRVCRFISHVSQAICDSSTVVLYVDEMKLPLYQTAERRWMPVDTPVEDQLVYNRRQVPDVTLIVIALCSMEKFEAVQIFTNEVTGVDFLYFLNNAIARLPAHKSYTVVADNATWHHAGIVSEAEVSKFLAFNEPKLFQLNLIENAFSYVRHAFRARPVVESLEEEAKSIVDIFFDEDSKRRFDGFSRQHLRNLIEFFQKFKLK